MATTSKKKKKTNWPDVTINPELDKLEGKVLFPEKLERANKTLERVGPLRIKKRRSK
jgi:hypothetical protein